MHHPEGNGTRAAMFLKTVKTEGNQGALHSAKYCRQMDHTRGAEN